MLASRRARRPCPATARPSACVVAEHLRARAGPPRLRAAFPSKVALLEASSLLCRAERRPRGALRGSMSRASGPGRRQRTDDSCVVVGGGGCAAQLPRQAPAPVSTSSSQPGRARQQSHQDRLSSSRLPPRVAWNPETGGLKAVEVLERACCRRHQLARSRFRARADGAAAAAA